MPGSIDAAAIHGRRDRGGDRGGRPVVAVGRAPVCGAQAAGTSRRRRGGGSGARRRPTTPARCGRSSAERDPAESELLRDRSALQAGRPARLGDDADRGDARSRRSIAQPVGAGGVYLSWRLLKSDAADVGVRRLSARRTAPRRSKVNARPITATTDYIDATAPRDRALTYWVQPAAARRRAARRSRRACRPGATARPVPRDPAPRRREERRSRRHRRPQRRRRLRLRRQASRRHASIPAGVRPSTDTYKIDGYDGRTGTFLWRIDLGWNINHGIWFSPMVVRDLDGDGKAEVCRARRALRGDAASRRFDGGKGFVLQGPEYAGRSTTATTGKEIDKADWIERGKPTDWADYSGNRSSRHMLGVAYLDGKTPSVLVVRGTYGLMKVDAWTLQDRKLREDLALDQRARAVQVPGPGPAQHQGRRHRRRRLRRDPERLDRHRQRRPHDVGHRAWATAIASTCRTSIRAGPASRSGTRSRIRIRRTASACGTRRAAR